MKLYVSILSCIGAAWCAVVPSLAQTATRDTLAFRHMLSDGETISKYVPMATLAGAYAYIRERYPPSSSSSSLTGFSPANYDGYYTNYTYIHRVDRPSDFVRDDDLEAGLSWGSTAYIPATKENQLLLPLQRLYDSAKAYRASYKDESVEKRRLVQALAAFDTAAANKPVFFSEIYGKFKGNIGKYVDHLYKHSILCNQRRMDKFVRYPKAEDLQKDPGVQFVIGMALYELWIKDVREGAWRALPMLNNLGHTAQVTFIH